MLYDDDDENQGSRSHLNLPHRNFSASKKPLQAMISSNDNLIIGGKNCIDGYSWNHLAIPSNNNQEVKPSWTVDLRLPTY